MTIATRVSSRIDAVTSTIGKDGWELPKSRKRTQTFVGTRITVCGKIVQRVSGRTIICLLPTGVPHRVHTSIALTDEGFLQVGHRVEGGKPVWHGVPDFDELKPTEDIET
jgi:hypothetical protein